MGLIKATIPVKLTIEQLYAFGRIMTIYLGKKNPEDIFEKATVCLIFKLNEKARNAAFTTKKNIVLRIDLPSGAALMDLFLEFNLDDWPYEASVRDYIISEIDKRTI
jgi:hypothetical protein